MRVQLTARIEPHTADYLAGLAVRATRARGIQVSVNQVAAALLERAEAEGWTIDPGTRPAAAPPQTSGPDAGTPPQPGAGPATTPPGR